MMTKRVKGYSSKSLCGYAILYHAMLLCRVHPIHFFPYLRYPIMQLVQLRLLHFGLQNNLQCHKAHQLVQMVARNFPTTATLAAAARKASKSRYSKTRCYHFPWKQDAAACKAPHALNYQYLLPTNNKPTLRTAGQTTSSYTLC